MSVPKFVFLAISVSILVLIVVDTYKSHSESKKEPKKSNKLMSQTECERSKGEWKVGTKLVNGVEIREKYCLCNPNSVESGVKVIVKEGEMLRCP